MVSGSLKELITEILSFGVRVPSSILGRRGGAGPAEGRAFVIDGVSVHAPISAHYTQTSPFGLKDMGNDQLMLLQDNTPVTPISVVPEPSFYGHTDRDGIGYRQIALLHGSDCLATTVLQRCVNWRNSRSCAFCGTEISLETGATIARKRPSQLAAVAKTAVAHDEVSHVVLTSGTADPPGAEIAYLAQCAKAIKAVVNLPIQAQFLPPPDLALMDELKASGVDSVGIHIESFHADTLRNVAPAKADIGLKRYEMAWKRAVSLFGPNQVSSFLIVGLGESPASVVSGSEVLADLGVYPFVVPFRPIPGSPMARQLPPNPEIMKEIYTAVADILSRKGLSQQHCKAGCVRCGACSALPLFEKPADRLVCHSTRNEAEKAQAFAIRKAVFVEEQGLFKDSDVDANDTVSTHLVAKIDHDIVGTVRVFPTGENGHWVGGRLAVGKPYRGMERVGETLVKEAMRRVKKKGCTDFTAHIQENNICFFKGLGWKPIGSMETYCQRPHQLMRADLERVPNDYQPADHD